MKKLLSILLSFCLLFAQVLPTWAQSAPSYEEPHPSGLQFNQNDGLQFAQDNTVSVMNEQQEYECANTGNISINGLVSGQMTRDEADLFLDKIECWLDSMEKAVSEQDLKAIKESLQDTNPLPKSDEEKALDQLVVQTLLTIHDKKYYQSIPLSKYIQKKESEKSNQDLGRGIRAEVYLNLLLPSLFSSLEGRPDLQEQSFSFLMGQIDPSSCIEAPKNDYDTKCADTLAAADALGGIWKYLEADEQKSVAVKLKGLLSKDQLQGPYASSILQTVAILLVTEGVDIKETVASATKEDYGFWNVMLGTLSIFSFTTFVEGNKDLWANNKIKSSYYTREGYKNHFNAWADLGRAWAFKALKNPGSNIAKNLDKTIDGLLNKEGYSIYQSVKDIEDRHLEDGISIIEKKDCPGAAMVYRTYPDPYGNVKTECHVVSDPLYPFIVGVFSTGYVPKYTSIKYEPKYLQAFLRRSYGRGQKKLDAATATYMNNLIALGYYALEETVSQQYVNGKNVNDQFVNGKVKNYTCKYENGSDVMCQHAHVPEGIQDYHDNFKTIYQILSGVDIAFAVYGGVSLGKSLCAGAVRTFHFTKLMIGSGRGLRAQYGAWRAVRMAFKVSGRSNYSVYKGLLGERGLTNREAIEVVARSLENNPLWTYLKSTGTGKKETLFAEWETASEHERRVYWAQLKLEEQTKFLKLLSDNQRPVFWKSFGELEDIVKSTYYGELNALKSGARTPRNPSDANAEKIVKATEQGAAAANAKKPHVTPKSQFLLGKSLIGVSTRLDAVTLKLVQENEQLVRALKGATDFDLNSIFTAMNSYGNLGVTFDNAALLQQAITWFDKNQEVVMFLRFVQRKLAVKDKEIMELMSKFFTKNNKGAFKGLGKNLFSSSNVSSNAKLDKLANTDLEEIVSQLFRSHLEDLGKANIAGKPLAAPPNDGFYRYTAIVTKSKGYNKNKIWLLPEVEFNRTEQALYTVTDLVESPFDTKNSRRMKDIVKMLKDCNIHPDDIVSVTNRYGFHEHPSHHHLMFRLKDGRVINYTELADIPHARDVQKELELLSSLNETMNPELASELRNLNRTSYPHEFLGNVQKALANEWGINP